MFHPCNNQCPIDSKRPLCILLDTSVGVWHLSNQQIEENNYHQEQEYSIDYNSKPPVFKKIILNFITEAKVSSWCWQILVTSQVNIYNYVFTIINKYCHVFQQLNVVGKLTEIHLAQNTGQQWWHLQSSLLFQWTTPNKFHCITINRDALPFNSNL